MSSPNSALSAWQLALIAVVAASLLAVWLAAVFLAARPDRAESAAAEQKGAGSAVGRVGPGQPKQTGETGGRLAA